jgi:hypothetical protein
MNIYTMSTNLYRCCIFFSHLLITFIIHSLIYLFMYCVPILPGSLIIPMIILGSYIVSLVIDNFDDYDLHDASADVDVRDIMSYRMCCLMTCHSLFVCNIYLTHVHDSGVMGIIARIVILILCYFVFTSVMYFANNFYDALKCRLNYTHIEKLNILWGISYTYILTTVIITMTTSSIITIINHVPINTISRSDDYKLSIILACISSLIWCYIWGINMIGWQAVQFVPFYKCTLSLMVIQITSFVAFIASILVNMVMNIIINSSHLIIIGSFTLVFVANIILFVGMILFRELIVHRRRICHRHSQRSAPPLAPLAGSEQAPAEKVDEVLPNYENFAPPPYEYFEPPPYVEC